MAGARQSGSYGKGEGIERDKQKREKDRDEGTDCARRLKRGLEDTERGFTRVDNVTYANTKRKTSLCKKMHKVKNVS